jgi:hypothetical protein
MKKTLALLVVVSVLAAAAYAVDVRSINTAGYHSHTANPGLTLVAPTLDNMDGTTLNEILGTQLPDPSTAFIWNGGGWSAAAFSRGAWGAPSPSTTLARGGAIFIQNTTGSPVEFSFTGEVPEERNGGGTTVVNVTGIDAVSYAYPASVTFVSTDIATSAPDNSKVHFWNGGGYDTAGKNRGAWGAPADTKVLGIGEAFFVEVDGGGSVDWTEEQPYDLQN